MEISKHSRHHHHGRTNKAKRGFDWMPNLATADKFVKDCAEEISQVEEPEHVTSGIFALQKLLIENPIIRMYFEEMFEPVPISTSGLTTAIVDNKSPWITKLQLINDVIHRGPVFQPKIKDVEGKESENELIGCPLNAVFIRAMATTAGFSFFRMKEVNVVLKQILQDWCTFLCSPESRVDSLSNGPEGWLSPEALELIHINNYKTDPTDKYLGFTSWNDFFTRTFLNIDEIRPVSGPNDDKSICNPCESAPFFIEEGVKECDNFWVKEQPYSLRDILADEHKAKLFVGGTIFQAFLSATNYHRWHSPISGTIIETKVIDGTYFSEAESEGFDTGGPNHSMGYLSAVATRAIVYIKSDDPVVGTVAVVFIGMAEVSSCVFGHKVHKGYRIQKGEELGKFQFGGSTYCLLFGPNVIKEFHLKPVKPHDYYSAIANVRCLLATAN